MTRRLLVVVLLILPLELPGQCSFVTTPLTSIETVKGNMFDVVNTGASSLEIVGFDQSFDDAVTCDFAVYTHPGTYVGTATNPVPWGSPAAFVSNHVHRASGTATLAPFGVPLSIVLPPGATQAFYITTTNAAASFLLSTPGIAGPPGSILATDGNLEIRVGIGRDYPFAATPVLPSDGRPWNGRVHYTLSPLRNYETNSPQASIDFNGVQTLGCDPAVGAVCSQVGSTANVATTLVGTLYDIVVSPLPAIPLSGGAIVTASGLQILGIDLSGPILFFSSGSPFPTFLVFPAAPISIPFTLSAPAGTNVTAQSIMFDFSHPDGFQLSQTSTIVVPPPSVTIPGPRKNDSLIKITGGTTMQATPTSPVFCAPVISFMGSLYTEYSVTSNGRITFGLPVPLANHLSNAPGISIAGQPPHAGAWADLNPQGLYLITITITSTSVTASYNSVPYFGQGGTSSTFDVTLALGNFGFDTIFGSLQTIGAQTGGSPLLSTLGVNPGGACAISNPFSSTSTPWLYAASPMPYAVAFSPTATNLSVAGTAGTFLSHGGMPSQRIDSLTFVQTSTTTMSVTF